MWTVSSHLVTCCVTIALASLLRQRSELSHDYARIRRLAKLGRDSVRQLEPLSSIAKRGGVLLDVLMQLESAKHGQHVVDLNVEDIIRQVSSADEDQHEACLRETELFVMQMSSNIWDGIFSTADLDLTGLLREVELPNPLSSSDSLTYR